MNPRPMWKLLVPVGFAFLAAISCSSSEDARVDALRTEVEGIEAEIQTKMSAGREYRDRLLAELGGTSAPDWAGAYGWGNGFEFVKLVLCPAGFYYEYWHCTGTSSLAYGEIESVEGPLVRLAPDVWLDYPELPQDGGRRRFRLREELYIVPWGDVRFVIPPDLMPEFCSLIRAESWDAMRYAEYPYLVVDGNYQDLWNLEETLTGVPDVPPEYRRFLPD